LVMMNNPEIIRASQYLAYQTIKVEDNAEDRIALMFRKATSRMPAQEEIDHLMTYLADQQLHFDNNVKAVNDYLSIGNVDVGEKVTKVELAAYAMLANVIYNLDESLSRS